jgi:hypothetical protein
MTIASIALPRWVRWESVRPSTRSHFHSQPPTEPAKQDIGGDIKFTYGLHRKCSSVTGACDPFPTPRDCERDGVAFCALWRSVGFLCSFAVLLEAACVVSLAITLLGGVRSRTYGWRVVCALMALGACAQMAGMAIVVRFPPSFGSPSTILANWRPAQAYEFDHDDRFFPGWKLDVSWILCTVSWCLLAVTGVGIGVSACVLPSEGGYELIPDDE